MNVLYVEDNPLDVDLTIRQVERQTPQVRIHTVDSLAAARRQLTGTTYDVLLSDLRLPDGDGMELLREVRQAGTATAVVILTAAGDERTAVAALRGGADDYIPKREGHHAQLPLALVNARASFLRRREQAASPLRVLYAEDEMSDIDLAQRQLARLAPHIHLAHASGADEVLARLGVEGKPESWDVLLLDYRLRGANGLELLRHVRALRLEIPIIMVSGSGDEEIALQALRLGASHYLPKRSTFYPELVAAIETVHARTSVERDRRALRASEQRFREVVETIQEVFWVMSAPTGRVLYASARFEEVWGRPVEALYEDPDLWRETLHPEDRERVCRAIDDAREGFDDTYRIVRPDGRVRWIRGRAFPVRENGSDTVSRYVGVAEDITAQKLLEKQFLQAQRLESIGTLAGGVAHDLNNILAPVCMAPMMLRSRLTRREDHEMLNLIETAGRRGAAIVRQLLTFSRGSSGESGPVQLRHLVREMMGMMRETFPREITLQDRVPADLWPVQGDGTQLHQVVVNLCVNARDAMHSGGTLTLTAENRPDTDSAQPPLPPGPSVVLRVSDTGAGMSAEVRERIFEPFFTTKPVGKGTGLGLSTVLGIVKGHRGRVEVESETGRGTTFSVYLPALPGAEVAAPAAPPAPPPRGRGQQILVVDDEEPILQMSRQVLEGYGYRVMTALDGQEALRVKATWPSIRLVITDLMMPRMGGAPLIAALRAENPFLPILVVSGLEDPAALAAASLPGLEFLAKPLEPMRLLEAVHRHLASASD